MKSDKYRKICSAAISPWSRGANFRRAIITYWSSENLIWNYYASSSHTHIKLRWSAGTWVSSINKTFCPRFEIKLNHPRALKTLKPCLHVWFPSLRTLWWQSSSSYSMRGAPNYLWGKLKLFTRKPQLFTTKTQNIYKKTLNIYEETQNIYEKIQNIYGKPKIFMRKPPIVYEVHPIVYDGRSSYLISTTPPLWGESSPRGEPLWG